jgi:hypothetical protein
MIHPTRVLGRGIFAAALLGALGFGTSQALASPVETAMVAGCSRYEAAECNGMCREAFGPDYAGVCNPDGAGGINCGCVQLVIPVES